MGLFFSLEMVTTATAAEVLAEARRVTTGTWVDAVDVIESDADYLAEKFGFAPNVSLMFEPHSPEATLSMGRAIRHIFGRFDGDAAFTKQVDDVVASKKGGRIEVTLDPELAHVGGFDL